VLAQCWRRIRDWVLLAVPRDEEQQVTAGDERAIERWSAVDTAD
jgi:hypothetical protein